MAHIALYVALATPGSGTFPGVPGRAQQEAVRDKESEMRGLLETMERTRGRSATRAFAPWPW